MFENLIESKQKHRRTLGQTALSVVVHAAIIVAAVKATQGVAETIKNRPVDTTMVFLKPPEPPKPPPEQPPPDVVVAANPP
ncbi:MAG: energy transducer TonB, partial [Gemmatimonadales bacterium]